MSIWFPTFATELLMRSPRHAAQRAEPMLLVEVVSQRQCVAHACAHAMAQGVRTGMPLSDARAILDTAPRVVPDDPARRWRALRSLAVWANRFTPLVSVDPPDGLLMDITGCTHLFGGEAAMLTVVPGQLSALGFTSMAAVAPTFRAARALSRLAPGTRVIAEADIPAAIGALPVSSLGIDAQAEQGMAEVGITRIHELLALPRSAVAARFGAALLLRLDQATGRVPERIDPVRVGMPPSVERVFQGPCCCMESLGLACRQMLEELCAALTSRGLGWIDGRITLQRSDVGPLELCLTLSAASAEPAHLWSLLRPRLERAQMGYGVEAVVITATRCRRLIQRQTRWWGEADASHASHGAVERLLDTLINRLGAASVLKLQAVESHIPELTRRLVAVGEQVNEPQAQCIDADRPTILYDPPQRVEVVAAAGDAPVSVLHRRGRASVIAVCIGPERIASGWWGGDEVSRDYFKVQAADGQWFWLFQDLTSGAWFLHGVWA